jgi:hypothetical protein
MEKKSGRPKSQKVNLTSLGKNMDLEDLAKRIRERCIEAALQAYEDAGIQGLCAEGRWEAAISALRTVELAPLLREFKQSAH